MKNKKIKLVCALATLLWIAVSCYKDQGNYDITMPTTPVVHGLDTLYNALVGDSLIIEPMIEGLPKEQLLYEWRIYVPEAVRPELNSYQGAALRIVFGLQAKRYTARLTLTNTENGMKYFYKFHIQGNTAFSKGSLVLSEDDGVTKLSFIKPDSTIQPNIYESINREILPVGPRHIHYLRNQFTGNTPLGYWVITQNGGVRLDVNNLQKEAVKPGTLKDNFFLAPTTLQVGSLQSHPQGVLMGVINGKFYGGTTTTWDQSNTYGMFGTYADGDYTLAPQFVMSVINNNFSIIAFENNKKQFVRLNIYGAPMYFGTQYTPVSSSIFDPTKLDMELLHMVQINNSDTYAYMKSIDGGIYELKFNVNFNGPFTFTAAHKRLFKYAEFIDQDTKMLCTRNGNIYIAHRNRLFRYNPISEQLTALNTTFNTPISMLKLDDDEQTLIVGAGSSIYYLDIQVGRDGDLLGQIQGIPGKPIDMTWRK
ncbi:PKD-like family lipoprotein [Sphingobacterium griseoflavum]|nr:PKD-like family lipoprotein [Sphingobacterium griseoflavum]